MYWLAKKFQAFIWFTWFVWRHDLHIFKLIWHQALLTHTHIWNDVSGQRHITVLTSKQLLRRHYVQISLVNENATLVHKYYTWLTCLLKSKCVILWIMQENFNAFRPIVPSWRFFFFGHGKTLKLVVMKHKPRLPFTATIATCVVVIS